MDKPENDRSIDIMRLASLARIAIDGEEAKKIERDLLKKLAYIDKIAEVDTEGVPPTLRISELGTDCREDKVKLRPSRNMMLQNVPQQRDGFIRVPTVIGEEEGM